MGNNSSIQWTDHTWNIARGCAKVDADCKNCYMYRDSMNGTRYEPRQVVRTKTVFNMPLKIKEPGRVFTCSLTDFFIEAIDSYRDEAWDIIRRCPHLTFQILTKRPERIMNHVPEYWDEIKNHVWLGTSVGSHAGWHRVEELVNATMVLDCISFLSLEPLHEDLSMPYYIPTNKGHQYFPSVIDWIIVGGESGNDTGQNRYRPCELTWMEDIVRYCNMEGIPVFVKQLGTHLSKELKMSDRHGGNIEEFPLALQVREFPKNILNTQTPTP